MPWMKVVCDNCGREFWRKQRTNQLGYKHTFCNHKCEQEFRNPPVYRRCKVCGRKFRVRKHGLKKGYSLYCSRECMAISFRKRIAVTCDYCGKQIYLTPARLKKSKKHFCSMECMGKFYKVSMLRKARQDIVKTGPVKNFEEANYAWGYLLGVLCSDGSIGEYKKQGKCLTKVISLLVSDKDFIDLFLSAVKEITDKEYIPKRRLNRKSWLWNVQIRHRRLFNTISSLSKFDNFNWRVPELVLSGNREIKKAFLNGFFDGEGSVSRQREGRLVPHLSVSSVNQEGLLDIGKILSDFDITFSFSRRFNKKYRRYYYTLTICRKEAVFNYWEQIGITLPEKKYKFIRNLKEYLKKVQFQRLGYFEIPNIGETADE